MSPKTKSDAAMYNWNSPLPSSLSFSLIPLLSLFPLPYLPDSSPIPPPSLPLWFLSSPWKPRCCWNLFTNLLIIMQTVLAIVCQPSCYIAASCHLYLQSFIGAVYTTTFDIAVWTRADRISVWIESRTFCVNYIQDHEVLSSFSNTVTFRGCHLDEGLPTWNCHHFRDGTFKQINYLL